MVDDLNREALKIEVYLNLCPTRIHHNPGAGPYCHLARPPGAIEAGYGLEMVSVAMADWAEDHGVEPDFIEPAKPTKTHTLSASTGLTAKRCWIYIFSIP